MVGAKKNSKHDPEKRKARVFAAALGLFSERKFYGTTMQMIANEAGVAAGTIYRFYESKDLLFNDLFKHWNKRFCEALFMDFPSHLGAREQFHALCDRLCNFAKEHPKPFLFIEEHHHGPYMDDASLKTLAEVTDGIISWAKAWQKKKVIKNLDQVALLSIVYGGYTTLLKEFEAGKVELTPALLKNVEDCFWAAVAIPKT